MDNKSLETLEERLNEHYSWPALYTFKFIVKKEKLSQLLSVLEGKSYRKRESSKGKYISVTVEIMAKNSREVISLYKKAIKIDGIICI